MWGDAGPDSWWCLQELAGLDRDHLVIYTLGPPLTNRSCSERRLSLEKMSQVLTVVPFQCQVLNLPLLSAPQGCPVELLCFHQVSVG